MRFRPCIDLHNGKVKQIVGGTLTDSEKGLVENFVSDKGAEYYAEMFKNDGLVGGHVIMLGTGNEEAAVKALRIYPGGLHIGGGINNENAAFYLENGASHVIVTSYVFKNGEINFVNLDRIISEVGKEKLVLDLSCRKKDDSYFVVTDRWQKYTDFKITDENITELSTYCDEFLIHAVDVEGKNRGINEELVAKLGEWVNIPTTYAGGASSLEDIDKLKILGKGKLDLTIGSALDIYGGKLSYKEVLKYFNK
jgi:phosphoribosylformimino-5-aminoimidazole carboxamide ribotide isomerase